MAIKQKTVKIEKEEVKPWKNIAYFDNFNDANNKKTKLLSENDKIQAKVRNKIAKFLKPTEHVDAVVYKEDRGETLIMLRLNDFLEIITWKRNSDLFILQMTEKDS